VRKNQKPTLSTRAGWGHEGTDKPSERCNGDFTTTIFGLRSMFLIFSHALSSTFALFRDRAIWKSGESRGFSTFAMPTFPSGVKKLSAILAERLENWVVSANQKGQKSS
jgi:hypothetical protein